MKIKHILTLIVAQFLLLGCAQGDNKNSTNPENQIIPGTNEQDNPGGKIGSELTDEEKQVVISSFKNLNNVTVTFDLYINTISGLAYNGVHVFDGEEFLSCKCTYKFDGEKIYSLAEGQDESNYPLDQYLEVHKVTLDEYIANTNKDSYRLDVDNNIITTLHDFKDEYFYTIDSETKEVTQISVKDSEVQTKKLAENRVKIFEDFFKTACTIISNALLSGEYNSENNYYSTSCTDEIITTAIKDQTGIGIIFKTAQIFVCNNNVSKINLIMDTENEKYDPTRIKETSYVFTLSDVGSTTIENFPTL